MEGIDPIDDSVKQELQGSPYDSLSFKKLSGGTGNFLYHATLKAPLSDGTAQVVVKHGEAFVASNRAFALPTSRCVGYLVGGILS